LFALFESLLEASQSLFARSFELRKTPTLFADTLLSSLSDAAVLFVEFHLMFAIVALGDGYFVWSERRDPADDLVVRTSLLKIRR